MILTILLTVNLLSHYKFYVEEVCELYPLQTEFVEAVIEAESSWNPEAESYCGAIGLMQVMPKWHQDRMDRLGVTDLKNPYQNILTGCDILNELFERYEDPAEVLMFYNMGYRGIELYEQGIISEYAKKILARAEELEKEHEKKIEIPIDETKSTVIKTNLIKVDQAETIRSKFILSLGGINDIRRIAEG